MNQDRAGRGRQAREARGSGRPRGSPSSGQADGTGGAGKAGDRAAPQDQPFRPPRPARMRRPALPEQRPFLPREAYRDLRGSVAPAVQEDVMKAVGAAIEALEEGDTARATSLLRWAKSVAPRSVTVREAYGVALYAAGDYAAAASELLAYRRLSGRADQNHLLADCARAAGRSQKSDAYVEEMITAGVDAERVAEGLIVLAGDRADHDDLTAALQQLERAGLRPVKVEPWHPRVWYLAADLYERMGQLGQARDYLEAVVAVDADFGDASQRLRALA
ncbi:MAG: tetratricopeptide repeat protein [Euzebyales bacterium]|nr:tetratricopeptide repeat protein [Euzebyales bacterium]